MTEEEAHRWFATRFNAEQISRIGQLLDLVAIENCSQNLVAPSTLAAMWNRHAADSAQLLAFAPPHAKTWLDIGTGGGFPGLVIAILFAGDVTLIEPRRRRADFLMRCIEQLGLAKHTDIIASPIESLARPVDVITARAVASTEKLLQLAQRCSTSGTRWILPRGKIDDGQYDWLVERGMVFHVEQSLTNPASSILLIDGAFK